MNLGWVSGRSVYKRKMAHFKMEITNFSSFFLIIKWGKKAAKTVFKFFFKLCDDRIALGMTDLYGFALDGL